MEELLIPNPAKYDVVTYNILIDKKEIDSTYQLLSLSISKEVNRVPVAKVIFRDGDASERTFAISDKNDFVPGKKIQINIGRDGTNKQVFKGIIVKHAVKVKANGHSQLVIECQDECVKMTVGRHSKYFEKIRDEQVFDELIKKYKLDSDPEKTTYEHKELVQHHITDWDFLLLRAEANGMLVSADDGKIKIMKPKIADKEVLQVNYGSSVLEFEAEMDARSQYKSVKAFAWDYANHKLFKADTSSTSLKEHGNVPAEELAEAISPEDFEMHHSGHKQEQELQNWVDGTMMRSRLSKIRGRAKFIGFGAIKPGDTVKLSGVGARFNGLAYVTAVRQDVGKGIWETQIQFGLERNSHIYNHPDINDSPSAGLFGSIHGLQVGIVEKLEGDPTGQDRILVKIPVIDHKAKGIWSRVASLDAGKDRGAFFRPEIRDEVIVGFINDDPNEAIVLGMLHSSKMPAPIKGSDKNHEKGFTTRSKMHISFNDDTKTITIDTPGGNSIKLDEKKRSITITDQNKNKITMEPAGIKMESLQKIDIKAGTVLTLGAGVSLAISAPALSMSGDGDVSIKGATTTLAATSLNTISGLPVKIN
jgi:Rhs element Vgr protein